MTLEMLLQDREIWQKNTIDRIREKILFKPVYTIKSSRSEKLVVIYGPPQIGKTTLILYLLGISDKYQKYVYNLLRAGIQRGNSSTSTAIIYQQCSSDLFGLRYEKNKSDDIEYFKADEIGHQLNKIRTKIENGRGRTDILYIYIPCKYFNSNSNMHSNINILDLPGDGSRNTKETAHVNLLINKYMAISSVNIIACKANEIQSLENLELPIKVDWRNLPNKYIIVITNSYSQGTIKKYFNLKGDKRKRTFWEHMWQEYKSNMDKIFNGLAPIEYFPIDIGDSLQMLLSGGMDKKDQKEVLDAAEKMGELIRQSIQKRNGNALKSTIMDLKAYSSAYTLNQMNEIQGCISELEIEIEEIKKDKIEKNKKVQICEQQKSVLYEKHVFYNKLKTKVISYDFYEYADRVSSEIMAYKKGHYVKDPDKKIVDVLKEQLEEYTKKTIDLSQKDCKEKFIRFKANEIYIKIENEIQMEGEIIREYYPGGFFGKKPKISEYIETVNNIFDVYTEQLKMIILNEIDAALQSLKGSENDYLRFSQWKILCERDVSRDEKREKERCYTLEKKKKEYQILKEQRIYDLEQLDDYIDLARSEFEIQKKRIKRTINSKSTSMTEKVYLIIVLGLIEKDYQSIIEMR